METQHSHPRGTKTGEARTAAADRLTMFVDAVTAIALTLLALELPVPAGDTTDAMLSSALAHGKEYLAFTLSFTVIAAHWRAHHEIFRYVDSLSSRLTSLTLVWLFMQVLMPFATRVLTADGAFSPGSACTRSCRSWHPRRSRSSSGRSGASVCTAPKSSPPEFAKSLVRSICLAAVFGVSVPVSFLITGTGAYLCWLAAPIVLATARRVQAWGQVTQN
jgi:hypothetical protein